MSKTLTRQTRVAPTSGDTMTRDGDPLHSRLSHDLVYGLNNLTYCSNYAGYVQTNGAGDTPYILETGTYITGETFLAQVPTVLPRDAYRFCWALGFYHGVNAAEFGLATYNHQVSIDAVTLYISPEPYTGKTKSASGISTSSGFVFDSTKMGTPYGTSAYSGAITCAASVREYHLADKSGGTTDIKNWMPFDNPTTLGSQLNKVWLILTFTRHSTDSAALTDETMFPQDLTWWVQYE